jgi:hypothetical protein
MQSGPTEDRLKAYGPSIRGEPSGAAIVQSQVDRRAYHLLNIAVLSLIALLALCYLLDGRLPGPEQLDAAIADEPLQLPTDLAPFDRQVAGETYHLVPVASYDIKGLVVSQHDSKTWWDYVHKEAGDFINTNDVCVVWGADAVTGIYREMSFSNTEWSCEFTYPRGPDGNLFRSDGLSNNHLLTEAPVTARALRNLRVGDQIRIKGYLVNYANSKRAPDQYRISSTTRTDTGDGACEIIYVTDLIVLSSATRLWSTLRVFCFLALMVCAVVWLMLPYRGRPD